MRTVVKWEGVQGVQEFEEDKKRSQEPECRSQEEREPTPTDANSERSAIRISS
jgi:hypothetical protein